MCLIYSGTPVKSWFDAAKVNNTFVDFKTKQMYNKYIGHDICNLVIEILFIIFGYV